MAFKMTGSSITEGTAGHRAALMKKKKKEKMKEARTGGGVFDPTSGKPLEAESKKVKRSKSIFGGKKIKMTENIPGSEGTTTSTYVWKKGRKGGDAPPVKRSKEVTVNPEAGTKTVVKTDWRTGKEKVKEKKLSKRKIKKLLS